MESRPDGARRRPAGSPRGDEPHPRRRPSPAADRADIRTAPTRTQRTRQDEAPHPQARRRSPRAADTRPTEPGIRPKRAATGRASGEIHTRPVSPTSAPQRPGTPQTDPPQTDAPTTPPQPPVTGGHRAGIGGPGARKTWGRGIVALVSVAVLVCTGYVWKSMNGLSTSITQLAGLGLGGADDGATDVLLVGMDSRTDAKGNPLTTRELRWLRAGDDISTSTDTILLIRIPNDGTSATAISIPRDSYVEVPGIGRSKINAAYGATRESVRRRAVEAGKSEQTAERQGTLAGRKALIDTVANLTGVHVDHYAEVGLLGFALLTKAVGGVEVCLKEAVRERYSGAKFHAGRQTLNGPQALSFVRQRHGLPRGDLDRITRQQVYMASLTQKILSAHTLTDPGKLRALEEAVSRSVVIDDDWNVMQFAEQLKDLSGGRVKFATIPVLNDHGWSDDGTQSVVTVDPAAVQRFTANLLNSQRSGAPTQRGSYTVDVDNAGTVDGLAGSVSNILTSKGFREGKTSSTPADLRDSVIYAPSVDDAGARLLAKDLGGMPIVADSSLPEHHLKLLLTNTFAGPGSISDFGSQTGGTSARERIGASAPPITADTDGPVCVN
ncbi:MAG: LCP family protein [Gordonia sp. (in: high G+C Gram-positive bacteria)]